MARAGFLTLLLSALVLPVSAQSFSGTVTEVKSGDIIRVSTGDNTVSVRLLGLDAPQLGQPYGAEAARFLRRRIGGARVRVEVADRGPTGRLVARVYRDGADVNDQLLRAGLAWYYWWYDNYTPEAAQDQTLEYRAQRADRGLWSQSAPVPPWNWRDDSPELTRAHSGPTGLKYNPSGRPRQCDDFETQDSAQRFMDAALPGVADALDTDGDGVACEDLPSE